MTDVQLPRMLELAFVRSPAPNARITSLDRRRGALGPGRPRGARARASSPTCTRLQDFVDLEGALKTPRVTLPGDRRALRRRAGGRGHRRGSLRRPRTAPTRWSVELETLDDDEPIHDGDSGRPLLPVDAAAHGDVAGGVRRRSPPSSRRRLAIQRVVTSALETCGIVADYDAASGELTCHLSTQMPHLARAALAESLGLPVSHVRVICPAMGGAFGGKEVMLPEYLCTAGGRDPVAAARALGRGPQRGADGGRARQGGRGRARGGVRRRTAVYARCARASSPTPARTRAESARTSSSWSPRSPCPGSTDLDAYALRHRRRRHPQGTAVAVPGRRDDDQPDAARGGARRRGAYARHRPDGAAPAQHGRRRPDGGRCSASSTSREAGGPRSSARVELIGLRGLPRTPGRRAGRGPPAPAARCRCLAVRRGRRARIGGRRRRAAGYLARQRDGQHRPVGPDHRRRPDVLARAGSPHDGRPSSSPTCSRSRPRRFGCSTATRLALRSAWARSAAAAACSSPARSAAAGVDRA